MIGGAKTNALMAVSLCSTANASAHNVAGGAVGGSPWQLLSRCGVAPAVVAGRDLRIQDGCAEAFRVEREHGGNEAAAQPGEPQQHRGLGGWVGAV